MIKEPLSPDLELLLERLPGPVQELAAEHPQVSEISLLLGRPLVLSFGGKGNFTEHKDLIITPKDLEYVAANLSGLKKDGRAGINGAAHRISVIADRLGNIIGLTIRIARFLPVLPPEGQAFIRESGGSVLIVGAPESGKTTLLRHIVAILAQEYGPNLSVVDTSNEIGGLGQIPHPSLGTARWHQVDDPRNQAHIIRRAIANHSPQVLVLDEVGYNEDVEEVEAAARRGIRVMASTHGFDLTDVFEHPTYHPLLGHPQVKEGRRLYRPTFQAAIEVRGKGKLYLIENLAAAIDAILEGRPPEGRAIGPAWQTGEQAYPPALPRRRSSPQAHLARALLAGDKSLLQLLQMENLDKAQLMALIVRASAEDAAAVARLRALGESYLFYQPSERAEAPHE